MPSEKNGPRARVVDPAQAVNRLLSRMQLLCARREYCTFDIRRKLLYDRNTPLTPVQAEEVIASLRKDKYLDDARYAGAFARDKATLSGWGEMKIRHALRAKSVSDADIDRALETVDAPSADARMEKLLRTRWNSLKNDARAREKMLRYALSRGYAYDNAIDLINTLCQTTDN